MTVKLLTERHLEFLSSKRGCTGLLSIFMSKCHIVGTSRVTAFMLILPDIDLQHSVI